ncbi:hypothetical protein M8818_005416 [Zalaria obscura]|uniref:Uncharacterized protein n=1 Tax=Zalaria obscura TaxID=2024903 RepID=A0ACC3S8G3_9PEZI
MDAPNQRRHLHVNDWTRAFEVHGPSSELPNRGIRTHSEPHARPAQMGILWTTAANEGHPKSRVQRVCSESCCPQRHTLYEFVTCIALCSAFSIAPRRKPWWDLRACIVRFPRMHRSFLYSQHGIEEENLAEPTRIGGRRKFSHLCTR